MTENPLVNLVPVSIDNAIKNISDSPTKAIGDTLTDIWNIVFGGLNHVAEKRKMKYAYELEQFQQELYSEISKIPSDKLIEPKLQVVAPALENAKYCIEEKELRNLFTNLITASLNKDTAEQVHPSFADIIKRMSPRDASNMASFGNISNHPIAEYRITHDDNINYYVDIPYVFLQNKNYTDLRNQSISISMLKTLGLVDIQFGVTVSQESYTPFYYTKEYNASKEMVSAFNNIKVDFSNQCNPIIEIKALQQSLPQKIGIDVKKGMISLTPIGTVFKSICVNIL
jgi:hypothetical protein